MRAVGIAIDLLRRRPRMVSVVAPLLAVASVLDAAPLIGFAPIIDLLVRPSLEGASPVTIRIVRCVSAVGLEPSLPVIAALFVALLAIKSAFSACVQLAATRVHFTLVRESLTELLRSFLGAGWGFFVRNDQGTLGNTLLRETDKIGVAFETTTLILAHLMRLTAYLVMALLLAWPLTLMTLGLLALALLPFHLLGRVSYRIGAAHTSAANEFQGSVIETLSASKLVLGYGNQDKALARIGESLGPYLKSAVQYVMVRAVSPIAFEPLGFLIALIVLYVGASIQQVPLSTLFIILYILKSGSALAMTVMNEKNRLENVAPSLEQIDRLHAEALRMAQPSGARRFERLERGISFNDVRFSYPGHPETLKGVSLSIHKGRMTALVGRSGSGKTTFLDLLMGFHFPDAGDVLVDGVSLRDLDVASWRRRLGFVPQDPFLFHASIRENLLWANESASGAELRRACAAANATEFIDELPQGMDTVVGDRGVRLSGGQRQRVAMARALLRRPELLILDEATSALDSQSELLIQRSVEALSGDVTVIAVAHRLSTIQKSEMIYVLDQGRIAESGSFERLMRIDDGAFLKAAELQGLKPPA
jgi:ABC-type multidrug transport system fused ATPase/permease subunit